MIVIAVSHLSPCELGLTNSSGCPMLINPPNFHFFFLIGHNHMRVSENQIVMIPILLAAAPRTSKTLLWLFCVLPLRALPLLKESWRKFGNSLLLFLVKFLLSLKVGWVSNLYFNHCAFQNVQS